MINILQFSNSNTFEDSFSLLSRSPEEKAMTDFLPTTIATTTTTTQQRKQQQQQHIDDIKYTRI